MWTGLWRLAWRAAESAWASRLDRTALAQVAEEPLPVATETPAGVAVHALPAADAKAG
jgi:hypothetical protein